MSCEWVNRTLKTAIEKAGLDEFVLICDNLKAQTSEEFKEAVRKINGIVYFGVPGSKIFMILKLIMPS